MSFILNKRTATAGAGARQFAEQCEVRRVFNAQTEFYGREFQVNAPVIDPRAWLDIDNATVALIGQEPDPLFNDLAALSQSIDIGKIVAAYRRLGAMDRGTTSLTGQVTQLMGQVSDSYDGVVIPIHAKAFGLEWRQVQGERTIGYDAIADNQEAATREVIRLMTVNMLDGNPTLNYQGYYAYGIRTNPNTLRVELAIDFTSAAATFNEIDSAFGAFVNAVRGGANRVSAPITVYISPEIESNWNRRSGAQTIDRTFLQVLAETPGVAAIKVSNELEGNEMLGVVLNRQFVRPLTAAAVTTTPVPRLRPFDDYQFITWSASGLQIRADDDGRVGVIYGTSQ